MVEHLLPEGLNSFVTKTFKGHSSSNQHFPSNLLPMRSANAGRGKTDWQETKHTDTHK